MRTITRTYDLFQLAELSAAARDTAYNEWLRTFEYGWDSDNRNTLEAFESVFKVKVNDWSYDTCRYSYRFTSRYSGEEEELCGIRLLKYIVNNYWHPIQAESLLPQRQLQEKAQKQGIHGQLLRTDRLLRRRGHPATHLRLSESPRHPNHSVRPHGQVP